MVNSDEEVCVSTPTLLASSIIERHRRYSIRYLDETITSDKVVLFPSIRYTTVILGAVNRDDSFTVRIWITCSIGFRINRPGDDQLGYGGFWISTATLLVSSIIERRTRYSIRYRGDDKFGLSPLVFSYCYFGSKYCTVKEIYSIRYCDDKFG